MPPGWILAPVLANSKVHWLISETSDGVLLWAEVHEVLAAADGCPI